MWGLCLSLATSLIGGVPGAPAAVQAEGGPPPGLVGREPGAPPTDGGPPAAGRHTFRRALMGTEFRIVLHAADSARARGAAESAFAHIARLEGILSDYDPSSELSGLAAAAGSGRWIDVSDDLWAVLSEARRWSERTDGAFDVTVGPLTRVWRRAARRGSLPSAGEVERARRAVGPDLLELDPGPRAVRLVAPGMRLDAGGIGKGYAADAALERLAALGFTRALVDAGGDLVAGAPPPGEEGWRVGLPGGPSGTDRDGCVLPLRDGALATSGAGERSAEVDGVRHSHILDPRTGAALTHGRVVTVVAPTATEADVLASALSVLGPAEGRALVGVTPGAGVRILEAGRDPVHFRFPSCPSDHET